METKVRDPLSITTISTRYENGALHPLEQLNLTEHQLVKVQILPLKVQITGQTAQRKVSRFILDELSYLMGGEQPSLIQVETQLYWRVPVVMTYPTQGKLGIVGHIDVDAETGKLLLPPGGLDELKRNARTLVTRHSPETA
jgi:predicted DNA-binding antitoxin AbrB/MazE fold protein